MDYKPANRRFHKKPWTLDELAALCKVMDKLGEWIAWKVIGRKESIEELLEHFKKSRVVEPNVQLIMAGVPVMEDSEFPPQLIRVLDRHRRIIFEFNIFEEQPFRKRL